MEIPRKKIAIIGSGVAGLTAAYLLHAKHAVTVFEKNNYAGGHTNTIVIPDGPDRGLPIDTGFIVYNDRNYPNFIRLLDKLGIDGETSDMSFGFSNGKLEYSSYFPLGLFAQKRNLFRPAFLGMICDMLKFNKQATCDLLEGRLQGVTLGSYMERLGMGLSFQNHYLIPITAALWSMSPEQMKVFPAEMFARFFHNHGLLSTKKRPQWKTIPNGSRRYVEKILSLIKGRYHVECAVTSVRRTQEGVVLQTKSGEESLFDAAVIATHADEALKLLADPSVEEQRLLGAWTYNRNHTFFHTDRSFMPNRKAAWASWNYSYEPRADFSQEVTLTYHMNRLQNLKSQRDYFVTLNTKCEIPREKIIREILYTHPRYTFESLKTQAELPKLNGVKNTYFCGSYFHFGFHEDAVKSAVAAVKPFGVNL